MKEKKQTATALRNLLNSIKPNATSPERQEKSKKKKYPEQDEDNLVSTRYPDFHLDTLRPAENSPVVIEFGDDDDSDDDKELVEIQKQEYRGKVDKDVAVFVKLAEKMSLESLIFLLQGQARAQNLPQEYLEEYKKRHETIISEDTASDNSVDTTSSKDKQQELRRPAAPKPKHFRFAEVTNNEVRTVVYEVESINQYKADLWWQDEEMQEIRQNAIDTVVFFQRHRRDYIDSIERIFDAESTNRPDILPLVKKLSEDSFTRGLESHIVALFFNSSDIVVQIGGYLAAGDK